MKKFLLILVVFSIVFASCKTPVDEPEVLTFEEAVQEVYEMTGRTLFYSTNGKTPDVTFNKATSENEIPGVCTDYAIEFAYYWNEIKNYDEAYGKAYFAWVPLNNFSVFYMMDADFVPDGTSKLRENSGKFSENINPQEMDGVWRDTIVTSIISKGNNNVLHFGKRQSGHVWIIIKISDDWYDTEPTSWDTSYDEYFPPYKITF